MFIDFHRNYMICFQIIIEYLLVFCHNKFRVIRSLIDGFFTRALYENEVIDIADANFMVKIYGIGESVYCKSNN